MSNHPFLHVTVTIRLKTLQMTVLKNAFALFEGLLIKHKTRITKILRSKCFFDTHLQYNNVEKLLEWTLRHLYYLIWISRVWAEHIKPAEQWVQRIRNSSWTMNRTIYSQWEQQLCQSPGTKFNYHTPSAQNTPRRESDMLRTVTVVLWDLFLFYLLQGWWGVCAEEPRSHRTTCCDASTQTVFKSQPLCSRDLRVQKSSFQLPVQLSQHGRRRTIRAASCVQTVWYHTSSFQTTPEENVWCQQVEHVVKLVHILNWANDNVCAQLASRTCSTIIICSLIAECQIVVSSY